MKKKKTLHLRKIKQRSTNKSQKFFAASFAYFFNLYFFKKFVSKKKPFYSFFFNFYGIAPNKILNYLKKFGLPQSFKVPTGVKRTILSKRLNLKFLEKNKKFNLINSAKNIEKLELFFIKRFSRYNRVNLIRYNNVDNKKKLYLHFSYRHLLKLPVRGQRTKTNAKTRKNFNII